MSSDRKWRIGVFAGFFAVLFIIAGAILWYDKARKSPASTAIRGNLEGSSIGGAFSLVDGDGTRVTEKDFDGFYRLVYFGYTYCPSICPTDMQNIASGVTKFEESNPKRAARVIPIFITIDPERDTPKIVKQFVASFHPRFIGLTGTPAEIKTTMDRFGIYAKKIGKSNYLLDHTALVYLFDPKGQPISFLTDPDGTDILVQLERHVQ